MMKCVVTSVSGVLVCIVVVVLLTATTEARYLPTRHGEITINDLLQALSSGKTLDDLELPNVEIPLAPEDEVEAATDEGKDEAVEELKQGILGGSAASNGAAEGGNVEMELPEKRMSYQYICFTRKGQYKLCSRRYK